MRYFLLLTLSFISILSYGQKDVPRKCASHYWDSLQLANNPNYASSRQSFEKKIGSYLARQKKTGEAIYQIPVVVHVIHNNGSNTVGGSTNSNISDAQIFSQIEVLNEDFRRTNTDASNTPAIFVPLAADVGIEFCLASIDPEGNHTTGITRHYSNTLPFDSENSTQNSLLKAYGYWPADQYLNIWVTELKDDVLGFATFPSDVNIDGISNYFTPLIDDGIVIDHRVFGRNTGTVTSTVYGLGRTTTHEVGHWLGLFHIWADHANCFATDYCNDTPTQKNSSTSCFTSNTSCTSRDMSENFMDYTYDQCLNLFTLDQKARMRTAMEMSPRRNALLSSSGCCNLPTNTQLPLLENFENNFSLWTVLPHDFETVGTNFNSSFSFTPTAPFPDTTYLTTPLIDLTELTIPFLSFSVFNKNKTTKLRVSYSLTCTEKWSVLKEYTGLKTGDWTFINIDLQQIKHFKSLRLRFEYLALDGSSLYLDNINLHDEGATVEIYPNPSTGQFTLYLKHAGLQKKTIEVYSAIGTRLTTFEVEESYSSKTKIDLSNYASGLYILKVTIDEQTTIQKILLTK